MPKKNKTVFVCSECGEQFAKWLGKCTSCGMWDTISEITVREKTGNAISPNSIESTPILLRDLEPESIRRIHCGMGEVDRVLGSGLVPGSVILVGGSPGIGKSTLALQIAAFLTQQQLVVLYISGEESNEQISLRAARLGLKHASVLLLSETCVESMCDHIQAVNPRLILIDSVQTVFSEDLESAPGSVSQVRHCTSMLIRVAKASGSILILIGHVTKEGVIAGPRVLEHMVDTVLYFEGDTNYQYRILRSLKNRFGPSQEIAILSLGDCGMKEVPHVSEFFLAHRSKALLGASISPICEGSRILVVESQALVNRTHFGIPQRVASGINPKKLSLIVAVLERYAGVLLGDHDIFFNIAGGLTVAEPAIDLGICAAIVSSYMNKPVLLNRACIGEIGLGGEIRAVNNMSNRLRELGRLGFSSCVVPHAPVTAEWRLMKYNLELLPCDSLDSLRGLLFE